MSPPPAGPTTLFHVVDSQTGEGLAGANIHFFKEGIGDVGETSDLLTDHSGSAAIPRIRGNDNVFVVANGYVPEVVSFNFEHLMPANYTMRLDPAVNGTRKPGSLELP